MIRYMHIWESAHGWVIGNANHVLPWYLNTAVFEQMPVSPPHGLGLLLRRTILRTLLATTVWNALCSYPTGGAIAAAGTHEFCAHFVVYGIACFRNTPTTRGAIFQRCGSTTHHDVCVDTSCSPLCPLPVRTDIAGCCCSSSSSGGLGERSNREVIRAEKFRGGGGGYVSSRARKGNRG